MSRTYRETVARQRPRCRDFFLHFLGDGIREHVLVLRPAGPDQPSSGEKGNKANTGVDDGHAQADLERRVGDGAHAELGEQTVHGSAPRLAASRAHNRVPAVEVRPVATIDVALVGAGGRARPAMPLTALRQLASTRRRFHSDVIDHFGELPQN